MKRWPNSSPADDMRAEKEAAVYELAVKVEDLERQLTTVAEQPEHAGSVGMKQRPKPAAATCAAAAQALASHFTKPIMSCCSASPLGSLKALKSPRADSLAGALLPTDDSPALQQSTRGTWGNRRGPERAP